MIRLQVMWRIDDDGRSTGDVSFGDDISHTMAIYCDSVRWRWTLRRIVPGKIGGPVLRKGSSFCPNRALVACTSAICGLVA